MAGVSLALAYEGDETTVEPWCSPADLSVEAGSVDLDSVCAVASELLFIMSGRRYGVRRKKIRPNEPNSSCKLIDGQYGSELVLPGPVRAIHSVVVDGVVQLEASYRLIDNRRLIRMPVQGFAYSWPTYQRLDLDDTAAFQHTVEIDFSWGKDVPEGGKASARFFADQLVKYFNREKGCQLSDRTMQVTRQGTTKTLMDPADLIRERKTGLYLVDTWLGAVNPNGQRKRPRVTGPDSIRKSRIT